MNKIAGLQTAKLLKKRFLHRCFRVNRSRLWQMFFKIDVLKNFVIFTAKHLIWSLFLLKLLANRPTPLLRKDSNAGFSCEYSKILRTGFFIEQLLCGTSPNGYFAVDDILILSTIIWNYLACLNYLDYFNPLMPGGNKKVTYTLCLSMCDLYVTIRH